MPVPQRMNFLVGWASCPPMKGLLQLVQDAVKGRQDACSTRVIGDVY